MDLATIATQLPGFSGQSYDLKDYINPERIYAATGVRVDSVDATFFLRDLTSVMARTYDRKYPNLVARQMLSTSSAGVDPAAESYVWRTYDLTQSAQVIDSYAADLPDANVKAKEFQSRVVSLGSSFQYNIMDLRRARMAGGIPLETRQAFAARRAIENAVEQMAFFGLQQSPGTTGNALLSAPTAYNTTDPAMSGFTNFPGLTVQTTTNTWYNNSSTAPAMSTISVATLVGDWNALFNTIRQGSLGIHVPNAVAMPLSMHSALLGAPRSTAFTEDTLLQYLLKMRPEIKSVYFTPMLENAGLKQDGSTRGPRMMMWEKNDENVEMVIPQEFEQFPPQMVNMAFKTACHLRFGGLRVSYPFAIAALDGTAG